MLAYSCDESDPLVWDTYPALLILEEESSSMGSNKCASMGRAVVCGLAYSKHEISNITSALVYTIHFAAKRQPIGVHKIIAFTVLNAEAVFTEAG